MLGRAHLRKAALYCLIAVLCASGWGWVRLVFMLQAIQRHERTLSTHVGGLVAHERRLQQIEAAIGVRYPSGDWRKRPTTLDAICSEAAREPHPRFTEVYARD